MARYDDYGLLIDYKYCTNCRSCEVSCQQEKGLASDQFGIRVFESKAERKGDAIDDAWDWAYVPMPTWRCDLCAERLDADRKPMCVKHCLAACMQVGPMDELAERAKELGDKVVIFKPTGAKSVDIGTIGPEQLTGEGYDPADYRREYDGAAVGDDLGNDWETREYRVVLQPDEISLPAFVALSIEDRVEFLQGEIVRGKTPEELLDELGLTMQELSNYDCVILGREVRAIPKKNTI